MNRTDGQPATPDHPRADEVTWRGPDIRDESDWQLPTVPWRPGRRLGRQDGPGKYSVTVGRHYWALGKSPPRFQGGILPCRWAVW